MKSFIPIAVLVLAGSVSLAIPASASPIAGYQTSSAIAVPGLNSQADLLTEVGFRSHRFSGHRFHTKRAFRGKKLHRHFKHRNHGHHRFRGGFRYHLSDGGRGR